MRTRENPDPTPREIQYGLLFNAAIKAAARSRSTDKAIDAAAKNLKLATFILGESAKAESVDELVAQECFLQINADLRMAKTREERSTIETAQKDYRQIILTISQMRLNPLEYFNSVMGSRESGGDYRKIPASRGPQQIRANRTRLRNRALFASEDQQAIWNARIKMADKTIAALKSLHLELAKDHEKTLQTRMEMTGREILGG